MSKQEEIKEIMFAVARGEIKAMAGLRAMSDLGVVIKVERELPYCRGISSIVGFCNDTTLIANCPIIKAGYIAVAPLINI